MKTKNYFDSPAQLAEHTVLHVLFSRRGPRNRPTTDPPFWASSLYEHPRQCVGGSRGALVAINEEKLERLGRSPDVVTVIIVPFEYALESGKQQLRDSLVRMGWQGFIIVSFR